MKRLLDYLFKPQISEKMIDIHAQCYNRMLWIIFIIFNPLSTWGTAVYFIITNNELGLLISVSITVLIIILNMAQLSLSKYLYKIPGDVHDKNIVNW